MANVNKTSYAVSCTPKAKMDAAAGVNLAMEVIDSNNELTRIRCWGVKPEKDKIFLNRPYMARLNYDENWGFSTYAIGKTFKLLG